MSVLHLHELGAPTAHNLGAGWVVFQSATVLREDFMGFGTGLTIRQADWSKVVAHVQRHPKKARTAPNYLAQIATACRLIARAVAVRIPHTPALVGEVSLITGRREGDVRKARPLTHLKGLGQGKWAAVGEWLNNLDWEVSDGKEDQHHTHQGRHLQHDGGQGSGMSGGTPLLARPDTGLGSAEHLGGLGDPGRSTRGVRDRGKKSRRPFKPISKGKLSDPS